MTKAKAKPNRLRKALLETTEDMRRVGVLSKPAYAKITKRRLDHDKDVTTHPSSGNKR